MPDLKRQQNRQMLSHLQTLANLNSMELKYSKVTSMQVIVNIHENFAQ